ncbi:MAG: UDP-N-acetylmuramate:L-alanyl-gamma-D-glutamyl-meso-diaminopimelate ligase, partial [Nitrospirae bacterium]
MSSPPTSPLAPGTRIHVSGICGTGTGALACLLAELGAAVRGSDAQVYPPMSETLAGRGIEVRTPYDPGHLADRPDFVVVGNALSKDHPEAAAARELGLATLSFPEAVARWVLPGRLSVVVAGTHGKTTTTTLTAHLLRGAGLDPGWLVGGVPAGLPGPARVGAGLPFVIEGDEYDTAYFDKGPKFLHYRPRICILTSVELDHLDIYPDQAAVEAAFGRLLALLPPEGLLVACADDPGVRRVVAANPPACPVAWYGVGRDGVRPEGTVRAEVVERRPAATHFRLQGEGGTWELALPMAGDHNVANATAAWLAARAAGAEAAPLAAAMGEFAGVRRRQEVVAEVGGVTLVDDFAHHPTAVAATLRALRHRFPGRRLWAVFEFRSNSAIRRPFEAAYGEALAVAD